MMDMRPHTTIRRRTLLAATFIMALAGGAAEGHDIPADAHIHAIVKPEGNRLRVLARAPLKAMLDVEFPERGPGFLDIAQADAALRDAAKLWIARGMDVYENDVALGGNPQITAVRVSLESDTSFRSFGEALAHITGPPLPPEINVPWNQAQLDVLLEYPIQSDRSELSIRPRFGRLGLRVETSLIFHSSGRGERAFLFEGNPGLIRLDPRWYHAAWGFTTRGFFHILEGLDHLLFLFCLVIPLRRLRPLIVVVTAFTLAHSVALVAAAYGLGVDALWFRPLVEALIAISILYMALENIVSGAVERRWVMAFAFGLIHGFGFSFALRQTMQFAGSHMLVSLAAFNVGVEIGQILALGALVAAIHLAYRIFRIRRERLGVIILSAFAAHTAWHWTIDRGATLTQYRFTWPALQWATLASATLWVFLLVLIAAVIWLVGPWVARIMEPASRTADGDSRKDAKAQRYGNT
jgi:hypothetical protein